MNTIIAFLACLVAVNAGVLVAPASSKIIQGPSSKTIIHGPDGSSISSVSPGGAIIQEDAPAVIAESAPLVAAAPAALTYSTPLTYYAPLTYSAYASAPLAYSGLVAEKHLDALVSGPSGSIATGKTVHRPALFTAPHFYSYPLH